LLGFFGQTPYMTVFFHEELDRKALEELSNHILSIKLYPVWITTNSQDWAKNLLSEKYWQVVPFMAWKTIKWTIL